MIPLKCDIPVDFEFTLSFVQLHPAFTVEPMSGRISIFYYRKNNMVAFRNNWLPAKSTMYLLI